jgi:Ser/Thr protein kinase RdoA (MazF antagonist)
MKLFPAQYSTLSSKALNERIKEAYGFSGTTTKFLLRGVSDTYLISEGSPKYVLKIYRNAHRSLNELQGEVELLNILRKHKAKAAFPLSDLAGNYIQAFEAAEGIRYGILFSYAEGKVLHDLSEDQLKKVGNEMAFNHNITSQIELKNPRPEYNVTTTIHKPLETLQQAFIDYNYAAGYEYLQAISKKVLDKLESFDTHSFNYGYCHYDYLPKNFHFTERDEFTLFDFDFAGKGFLLNDLMSFQIHYFFQILFGGMPKDQADHDFEIFVNAYREKRAITKEELEAIPYFGVMYWIYYLAVQYENYDDFSNHYFNLSFLKKWINWIERWESLYCKF